MMWRGNGSQIGYEVAIVYDPLAVLEAVVDQFDGSRRPTSWMQRMRRGSDIQTSDDWVPRYHGRECCYRHLTAIEPKVSVELRPPFETECPTCRRRFRVTIGVHLEGTANGGR